MTQLGKYQIHEKLGEGATAEVYRATDTSLSRDVALKVLKPVLMADTTAFDRFRQEARAAAVLFHPHIATVLEMGEAEGRFFITMRYIKGSSLTEILQTEGPQTWETMLRMARQIGEALDYAHGEGFLHRDVKPSNILRDEKGDFWLTDFGLARAMMSTGLTSHTGAMLGTPAYIPPEIWNGQEATPASDQYALACVIAESLTGEPLFAGDTPQAIITRHLISGPQFPTDWPQGVPDGIKGVLEKALAKEPADRFTGAGGFVKALGGVKHKTKNAGRVGAPLPADRRPPRPHKKVPKNLWDRVQSIPRWGMWVILASLLILGGVWIGRWVNVGGSQAWITPTLRPTATPTPRHTATSTLGIGSTRISEKDGMVQVYVPAGGFEMGSPAGDPDADDDEFPQHRVYLDAYWMDQTEVTYAMYAQFLDEMGNLSEGGVTWLTPWRSDGFSEQKHSAWRVLYGLDDHPVVGVSWYGARAYCEWAGARLPTEAEWEKAARGGLEGKRYPWGDEAPVCTPGAANGAQFESCAGQTVPVGTFAPNGYGLYDMAGNVWEWVADWYDSDYYTISPLSNPPGPASAYRVLRGGSWYYYDSVRSADRNRFDPSYSWSNLGFRCARSAASP